MNSRPGLKSKVRKASGQSAPSIDANAQNLPGSAPSSLTTEEFLAALWSDAHDSILWADRQYVKDLIHPQLWSRMEFEFDAAERAMSYSHIQHQMLNLLNQALSQEQVTDQILTLRTDIDLKIKKNQLARARIADTINVLLRSACRRRNTYEISSSLVDDVKRQVAKYCYAGVALNLCIYSNGEVLDSAKGPLWRANIESLQLSEMASDALRQIILQSDVEGFQGSLTLRRKVYDHAQSVLENLEAILSCSATVTEEDKQQYRRVREDMINYEALMNSMGI